MTEVLTTSGNRERGCFDYFYYNSVRKRQSRGSFAVKSIGAWRGQELYLPSAVPYTSFFEQLFKFFKMIGYNNYNRGYSKLFTQVNCTASVEGISQA